jgi:hypothetical protein
MYLVNRGRWLGDYEWGRSRGCFSEEFLGVKGRVEGRLEAGVTDDVIVKVNDEVGGNGSVGILTFGT